MEKGKPPQMELAEALENCARMIAGKGVGVSYVPFGDSEFEYVLDSRMNIYVKGRKNEPQSLLYMIYAIAEMYKTCCEEELNIS